MLEVLHIARNSTTWAMRPRLDPGTCCNCCCRFPLGAALALLLSLVSLPLLGMRYRA